MLPKDIYATIAGEAKKNNMYFAWHVPFSITTTEASNTGQQSIEHLSADILISVSANEAELRAELVKLKIRNATQSSNRRVVYLDLEKFFDEVNHHRLMRLLSTRIGNKRVLQLCSH